VFFLLEIVAYETVVFARIPASGDCGTVAADHDWMIPTWTCDR
jgi:hypothetical protein